MGEIIALAAIDVLVVGEDIRYQYSDITYP
jgi:hypothetical protein